MKHICVICWDPRPPKALYCEPCREKRKKEVHVRACRRYYKKHKKKILARQYPAKVLWRQEHREEYLQYCRDYDKKRKLQRACAAVMSARANSHQRVHQ